MEQFITRIRTNLNGVLEMTQMFEGLMMTGDNLANRIIVSLNRDGTPIDIPGDASIIGYVIRNDGYTLDIPGSTLTEDGLVCAYIDIPAVAYLVSGPLSVAIRMIQGEQKVVIATASCYVNLTETGAIIDTSHRIPDVEELLSHIADIDAEREAISQAEAARVIAEEGRVSAEEGRASTYDSKMTEWQEGFENKMDDFDEAETQRQSDFDSFMTSAEAAELAREKAEKGPNLDGQGGRIKAEADRAAAEGIRQSNESTRQTQETAREQAQAVRNALIDGMTVEANELAPYSTPTVTITEVAGHKHIIFGLRPGDPFVIQKVFTSVAEMNAYTGTDIRPGQFVVIAVGGEHPEEDPDNAKMYVKTPSGYSFIMDLSGAQGIQGPIGLTGNGIASCVLNQDYTLTVNYTDGTSYTTTNSIRGLPGETGNGISYIEMNQDYTLTIVYTDGTSLTTDPIRGAKGDTGVGIDSVSMDSTTHELTITMTDGTSYTTPSLKGDAGFNGANFNFDSETHALEITFT